MEVDIEFYGQVLDAISDQIAVINRSGRIIYVNSSWASFSHNSEVPQSDWVNTNYLETCAEAARQGDSLADRTAQGLRQVMQGDIEIFSLKYHRHTPVGLCWFIMEVSSFLLYRDLFYVVTHKNITQRVITEQKTRESA